MGHRCASFRSFLASALAIAGSIGLAAPAGWAVTESEPGQEAAAAAPTADPAPSADPATTASPESTGEVARSAFTSGIADREPIDQIETVGNDVTRVYYFTELQGLDGQTVTHRWEYGGEVKAEVPFEVGAPRWRVSSSKNLDPGWTGEWTVSVVDGAGNTLSVEHFSYTKAEPAAAPAATETIPAETEAAPASPAAP